ncbi:MAG: MiaB/RimO family radical SAM methylthiotransferase [bacterium]|nr:MiaB/RimO family radical SAM methylthiotransferase [bacterium]
MRKVWCSTLGCDKNLVDSEALLGHFARRGAAIVREPEDADIWVLNTCGFIDAARGDSERALREMCEAKEDRFLAVCGCWSQEHGDMIRERFPDVDVVAGVGQFANVVAACLGEEPAARVLAPDFPLAGPASSAGLISRPEAAPYGGLVDRPLLTPSHVAFVKIGEGCNCHCTFCRIPLIRGPQRSRPVSEIVEEVRGLAGRGVREIQIVSQNTTDFGRETGETLLQLVTALSGVDDLRWIRLLYLYSGLVSADDLRRLLDLPKVAPYLDLPIQHASPRLLKAMKRPGGEKSSPAFFRKLREGREELVLRTTVLLGFPGEEDEDVEQLADFLAEVSFDHVGTHHFSPESGTPAARMDEQVSPEVVLDREALITDVQAGISLERQESRLGQVFDVVIDEVVEPDERGDSGVDELAADLADGQWLGKRERRDFDGVVGSAVSLAVGRSYHFGYDLDGCVLLAAPGARPGEIVKARFAAVTPFDVWGEKA